MPGKGQHRFKSKAQWRWAFSTHKTWARRWAHASPSYKLLPRRKGIRRNPRGLL